MDWIFWHSPIGALCLVAEKDRLRRVLLPGEPKPEAGEPHETEVLRHARWELCAYFRGALRTFETPLEPLGTEFEQDVWAALARIPYGETRSYRDVAEMIARPNAARAVGRANHKNPLPILIPCHRVIGANGEMVGYGGGLALKRALLALEQSVYPTNAP